MAALQEPKRKRKRAPHTRSRLGCQTCRIRHVRCDQTRPACTQCTGTGRTCDGYPAYEEKGKTDILVQAPSISPVKTNEEHRSLQYFQHYTAVEFAGLHEHELWCTLVLQAGTREPCILHSIIALGSLHEAFQHETSFSKGFEQAITTLERQAGYHYTKAIGLLNAHIISYGWLAVDMSLLCCILCVSFEWLRGSYTDAQLHLNNGLRILTQWTEDQTLSTHSALSLGSSRFIRSTLAPVFMRLALQARTYTHAPLPWDTALLPIPQTLHIDNLKAAYTSLNTLLAHIYFAPRSANSLKQPNSISNATPGFLNSYMHILSMWSDRYTAYLATTTVGPQSTPQTALLHAVYTVTHIMLSRNHSNDQMRFDAFLPEFASILASAEIFLGASSSSTTTASIAPTFTLDILIIPILYFVALRCRDPMLRRKAIALNSRVARREGAWDSRASARLAMEVVAVEERGRCVISSGDVRSGDRVRRLKFETDLGRRCVAMRFERQSEKSWSRERVIWW
ncbi:hypothetical protein K458DRAFT_42285 [Lentithecium fluviatile CBS 122367]|uniref:Zn(2)-C6 fungal-type domain-containing protein n=1 Tax=Lentithecium fluviatile CBS 122367 TaxID=1168545 RepID=A0A6G1J060_9PLEO|nr:hypothetical protein K458DRAFT_42285 [Lentithecium fluviatile CBS 122367]